MSKFEIYKDKKGETRFRYRASNGEIVFSSEGYKARASAMKSIESLKKNVATATVEEAETPAKKKSTVGKVAGKAASAASKVASTVMDAAAAVTAPIAKAVSGKTTKPKAAAKPMAVAKPKPAPKAAPKPKAAAKPKAKAKA